MENAYSKIFTIWERCTTSYKIMLSDSLNLEVWDRILGNKSLDGLGLEIQDERVLLHGLRLPDPIVLKRFQFQGVSVSAIDSGIIYGAKWKNLDFSKSKLGGIRLSCGVVENCRFDNCNFKDARIWATSFSKVSFKRANLQGALFGGVDKGVGNKFLDIDFSQANLKGTSYQSALFERCIFVDSHLSKIDFQSSSFKDCRFEGMMDDVLFYDRGFGGEGYLKNEMINVDFSRAVLHDVGFRNLSLDSVRFPDDKDHLVIRDFKNVLDRAVEILILQGGGGCRNLDQVRGYLSKVVIAKSGTGVN